MQVFNCRQGSEEWDNLRRRPTASEFGSFITPARGDYSKQSTSYAAKIVAKRLGVYTEPPPSYWMEWGTEMEPNARHAYTKATGRDVQEVGFIMPDHHDDYGGSPDGLIGEDGILETKCPAPETLIAYHASGTLPSQYKPQIQGLLMISGRPWCDFFVFHPGLSPFLLRVERDEKYIEKMAEGLGRLLSEIERIEGRVSRMDHELVSMSTTKSEMRFSDE